MLRATSTSLLANYSPLYTREPGPLTPTHEQTHNVLDLVNLRPLMELSKGRVETIIGLIDGPVAIGHPDLQSAIIREIPGKLAGTCAAAQSLSCLHGTLVAGVLIAKRESDAPAICPECTLLVRPIFSELSAASAEIPSASPLELAEALVDCVSHGANIINLSASLARPSARDASRVAEALDYCGNRGVIVVAAAGNQGTVGGSCITRHPCVIPVVACDLRGQPISYSNLGNSIGRHGLRAPGAGVVSLGVDGSPRAFGGTSAAAPFVTGTLALLCSIFPNASRSEIESAVLGGLRARRSAIVPALLDADSAYRTLHSLSTRFRNEHLTQTK